MTFGEDLCTLLYVYNHKDALSFFNQNGIKLLCINDIPGNIKLQALQPVPCTTATDTQFKRLPMEVPQKGCGGEVGLSANSAKSGDEDTAREGAEGSRGKATPGLGSPSSTRGRRRAVGGSPEAAGPRQDLEMLVSRRKGMADWTKGLHQLLLMPWYQGHLSSSFLGKSGHHQPLHCVIT